jgi:predicted CXXCH cytochrome family protein
LGGLSRFSSLINDTKQIAGQRILIQTGNFASKKSVLQGDELQQNRLKAELQITVLQRWNVTAIGLGTRDFTLGLEWWGNFLKRKKDIPLVSTNVQCPSFFTLPSYIVDPRSKVGILSVLPEKFSKEGCTAFPIESSIKGAIEEARGLKLDVERWIVMGEVTTTEQLQIGQKFPEIDLYFDAKSLSPKEEIISTIPDWASFSSGSRGKHVGVVYWSFDDNSNLRFSGQKEKLTKDLKHNQKTLQTAQENLAKRQGEEPKNQIVISRAKNRVSFYEKRVQELEEKLSTKVVSNGDAISFELMALSRSISNFDEVDAMIATTKKNMSLLMDENPPAYKGAFVGSSKCQSCHAKQYESWNLTPHAHAYQTLKNVNRNLDYDCYSCHVTGAFTKGGPTHPKQFVGEFENVGCESCHGPAGEHVSTGSKSQFAKPSQDVCTNCHDGIRDQGRFDFNNYMESVRHACIGD